MNPVAIFELVLIPLAAVVALHRAMRRHSRTNRFGIAADGPPMSRPRRMTSRLRIATSCIPLLLAGGCVRIQPSTEDELNTLANPPAEVRAEMERVLPQAIEDAEEREREVLEQGRPLTKSEMALARKIGVMQPERVRVSTKYRFKAPRTKFVALPTTCAITSGHAIQIGTQCTYHLHRILAHELTHVLQFEQLGVREFEREFLLQMILVGPARAPLEMQARNNERLKLPN